MAKKRTSRQYLHRLLEIRNRYDCDSAREKLQLLRLIRNLRARTSSEVRYLHTALCFIRAFPDSKDHYVEAQSMLARFERRIAALSAASRQELWDTGMAGTPIHYRFSYEVAVWLAANDPGRTVIDWDEIGDTTPLDQLLEHLLLPAETEYFDSGYVRTRDWLGLASATADGTEFDWLIAQLKRTDFESHWRQLYNNADIPLSWNMGDSAWSVSRNVLPVRKIAYRRNGMRQPTSYAKRQIMRPVDDCRLLRPGDGAKMIEVAMASLAVRHRETYHFNFANRKEVYLANVGEGVAIAIFGLRQQHRFPLECTMGYLILSNGVPIGYGGASLLFRQINTGVNIFPEYRGSEAAYLWLEVMRVYHHLTGCNRFIANPYQFGADNVEALRSGAFWFYYRLGYRPVLAGVRKLAKREAMRMRGDQGYRSDDRTLTRLACCDMHLTLPGARAGELFEERWIETSSMLATVQIGNAGGTKRADSAERLGARVMRDLDIRSMARWSNEEQRGFRRLAPFVAAAEPATWNAAERKAMRELVRAKGGGKEASYARLLGEHRSFLVSLRNACRRAEFH